MIRCTQLNIFIITMSFYHNFNVIRIHIKMCELATSLKTNIVSSDPKPLYSGNFIKDSTKDEKLHAIFVAECMTSVALNR